MNNEEIYSLIKIDYHDLPGCFSWDIERGRQPNAHFTGTYQDCLNLRVQFEDEWEREDRCWHPEYYEDI